jgi:CBS domain-containing protein
MRLASMMKTRVHTAAPTDSLDKAICLMDERYIQHLPVVEAESICVA